MIVCSALKTRVLSSQQITVRLIGHHPNVSIGDPSRQCESVQTHHAGVDFVLK